MTIHRSQHSAVEHIPKNVNLTEFVFRDVAKHGDKAALIDGRTGKQLSFNELHKAVERTAAGLQRMGMKKGDVVAAWSPNNIEYVTLFHGVVLGGGTLTTLNPIYTASEVAHQLDNAGAKFMVCEPSFMPRLNEARKHYTAIEQVFVFGEQTADGCRTFASLQIDSTPVPVALQSEEDVVVLPFSSGTTGLPKGVMLTHFNIIANLCQLGPSVFGLTHKDTLLAVLPFYHIYGICVFLNVSIFFGCTSVILPGFEPQAYLKCLKQYGVTVAHVAPPLVQFLAKSPDVEPHLPFPKMRRILSGAAPLGVELSRQVQERLGQNVQVEQGFGMTEMSPVSHVDGPGNGATGAKSGSIGRLVPNMECKIVDPQTGALQPAGGEEQRGELWLRGPNIMKGYHRNDKATKECIDDEGYLHTGDIGYVDHDGVYFIVDRMKELIKAKGYQVAPAELEALLVKHEQVADAAVIGVAAEKYGGREGDGEVPKAFVILQPGSKLSQQELADWLAPQVVTYKRINAVAIDFVESVPKSGAGKILRKDLREIEKSLPPKSKL